ncbi:hypothetical protein HO173_009250 [Letharia columbiana]|uniref:Uncharacterized protein n=1 Tax=Letharia columbiana TaxID=112416 RepID=A0A8H6L213_9LECA|nr:uncharacterized protein HO173_009250 [Letharia columbiana]KAF6232582.1 hypothetical protein HO173_009250 [Letharia columbiana]
MCIAFGYNLYKKSQAKKAAAGNPNEKDYAPKPHPVNAGPPQTNYPPPANGQPPRAPYNPDQSL